MKMQQLTLNFADRREFVCYASELIETLQRIDALGLLWIAIECLGNAGYKIVCHTKF